MNEAPSLDEIVMAWEENCCKVLCKECKLKDDIPYRGCQKRYIHAILTGKMKLTDGFRKEEPETEPKAEIPDWCKEGAWVTESCPEHRLGFISGIFADGRIGVTWVHNADGYTGTNTFTKYLKPVRFREYTFEEAKGLLGKVMEYNWEGITPAAAIIGMVSRDSFKVYCNGSSFEELQDWDATIDGVPIGVPEIDEEVRKEGEE